MFPLPSSRFLRPCFCLKRLWSNRRTHTLRRSLLQGHILLSWGPRHPRPAPLVLQVLVSHYVIDWGEGLAVPCFAHTFFSCLALWNRRAYDLANNTRQMRPPPPHTHTQSPSIVNVFSYSTFSPSHFVTSPAFVSSNRLTRSLRDSLLQGHILTWPNKLRIVSG